MTPTAAARYAEIIAADGFASHDAEVERFVACARGRGICSVLLDVVADVEAPPVARLRALGRAVTAYVAVSDAAGSRSAAA